MNVIKYQNEEEIPKYNCFALVTKAFRQEDQNYINYINLYFSQSERSNYLTKQALSLESSYYLFLGNLDDLRRIYDYYIESFPQNENNKVTLDILKITYRYSKCLYNKKFYYLAKKYACLLLSGNGLTQAQANDINNLVNSIDKDFQNVIKDKTKKLDDSLKTFLKNGVVKEDRNENEKEKKYLIAKEWIKQIKNYLINEKDEDFPGDIDNHSLLQTTKTVIQYNDNPSHISNYLLKDSNDWIKIDESIWNKIKSIFNTTCEIEATDMDQEYIVYKILVLEQEIKTNHVGLLKPLYVKIPKETTINEFKELINKWLFKKIKKETRGKENYTHNIYKIKKDNKDLKKKFLIFDIIYSYLHLSNFSCSSDLIVTIPPDNLDKVNTIVNGNDDILIIEIHKSDEPNFLKIFDKSNCSNCNKHHKYIKCNKCVSSVCTHFYCSEYCRNEDKIHLDYHNKIQQFIDYDYKLLKVLHDDIANYTSSGGIHGFRNLGNTCFMNAGLQCITHCEALSTYFLSGEYKNDNLNSDNEKGLVQEFERFVSEIWTENNNYTISPSQMRKKFVELEDEFNNYSQHDSPQMMIDFLNILSAQLNRSQSKQYLDEDIKQKTSLSSWNTMLNQENSIIKDLFYGLIHNQQKCPICLHVSDKYERFLFFSVPIPTSPMVNVTYRLVTKFLGFSKTSFEEKSFLVNETMTLKEFRTMNSDFNKGLFDVVKVNLKKRSAFLYRDDDLIIDNYIFKDVNNNYDVFVIDKSKNSVPIFVFYYKPIKENKPKEEESWFSRFFNCCCRNQNEIEIVSFELQNNEIFQYPVIIKKTSDCVEFDLIKNECKKIIQSYSISSNLDTNESKNKIYYCITNEFGEIKEGTKSIEHKSLNVFYQLPENANNFNLIINSSPKEGNKKEKDEEERELNLHDCLKFNYHISPCSLKCEECNNETTELTSYISKIPYYFCIHLKRFYIRNHDFVKNNRTIQYDENLNIYDYVDEDLKRKFPKEYFDYELFGVNIHSGGVYGGHYYAYCKVRGQWYEFNDSSVSATNHFSSQAYVLFYKKKQITQTKEKKEKVKVNEIVNNETPNPKTNGTVTDKGKNLSYVNKNKKNIDRGLNKI